MQEDLKNDLNEDEIKDQNTDNKQTDDQNDQNDANKQIHDEEIKEKDDAALKAIEEFENKDSDDDQSDDDNKDNKDEDIDQNSDDGDTDNDLDDDSDDDLGVITKEQIEWAEDLGVKKSYLNRFKTTEEINAYLALKEDQILDADIPQDNDVDSGVSDAKDNKKPDNNQSIDDIDEELEFIKEDDNEYDEDLLKEIKSIKKVNKLLKEKLNEFENRSSKYDQLLSEQERNKNVMIEKSHAERENQFEKEIETLGEEFSEILGKGNYRQINKDQLELRREIFDEMNAIEKKYVYKTGKSPGISKVFKKAVDYVLADDIRKIERKKLLSKAKKQNKSLIRKPQQSRSNRNESGEAAALKTIEEFFSKNK